MNENFKVTKVVSPAMFCGEEKNQDRAGFSSPTLTACLCDGVSTSPYAANAAELTVELSSILFGRSPSSQLEIIARLLTNKRLAALESGINVSHQQDSIKAMLQEAARVKLKKSFQTTVVAGQIVPEGHRFKVKFLSCGDSGIFAFDRQGELLYSNLALHNHIVKTRSSKEIPFGPSQNVICKIICKLSECPELSRKTNITNGVLCEVLSSSNQNNEVADDIPLWLSQGERLIVPAYLVSKPKDPEYHSVAHIIYSQYVQRQSCPTQCKADVDLMNPNNSTAVMPDHFYNGQWNYTEETFSKDAHLLFCSDGFYRCFKDVRRMWRFLRKYEVSANQKSLQEHLHQKLSNTFGDDDISFIWISSNSQEGGDYAC